MFANKSKVESYIYSVDLSKPIDFFCKLINDISENSSTRIEMGELFTADFNRTINFKYDAGISTINDLAAQIAQYYQEVLMDEINIQPTNILFIYKYEKLIFSYNIEEGKLKSALGALIQGKNVFKQIISHVSSDKIKAILENLQSLKFPELFSSIITLVPKGDVTIPYIPLSFFDLNLIEEDPLDVEYIRVNQARFKKELEIEFDGRNTVSLINIKQDSEMVSRIGIRYNGFVFPTTAMDLDQFILNERKIDYYWLLFKRVFTVFEEKNKKAPFENELLKEFKESIEDKDLSFLLSSLQKNFLVNTDKLHEYTAYDKYFEEVTNINELDGIKGFDFYITKAQGKTSLGIYTDIKFEKSYNLLHWIQGNETSDTLDHYRNSEGPKAREVLNKFVLKPELAFYFLSDYFEDFLEKCISAAGLECIRNFHLFVGGSSLGEIDFLIKSGNKLCFVEAKTKLTNLYIEEFIVKCENILEQAQMIPLDIEIRFYIIAAFSDSTCENKRYFIDETEKEDYNVPREGLMTTPYYFEVPIPKYKKAKLVCIAEPEFAKLKSILSQI